MLPCPLVPIATSALTEPAQHSQHCPCGTIVRVHARARAHSCVCARACVRFARVSCGCHLCVVCPLEVTRHGSLYFGTTSRRRLRTDCDSVVDRYVGDPVMRGSIFRTKETTGLLSHYVPPPTRISHRRRLPAPKLYARTHAMDIKYIVTNAAHWYGPYCGLCL